MRILRAGWLTGWIGVLMLLLARVSFGQVPDQFYQLHPYISLQGAYSDNINLTQDNKTSDFITTISPGLKYISKGPGYNFELGYQFGLNFYASDSQNNYVSHEGHLNTFYNIDPRWTLRLNDALIRSREGIETFAVTSPSGPQSTTAVNTNQTLFLRHTFEPAVEYKFGREDLVSLQYRNMIYRTDSSNTSGGDSTENAVSPHLGYWFDIRNGITLDYTYSTATFENQPDFKKHYTAGQYRYRFNPRTTAFGKYSYSLYDYDAPGIDYSVHSSSIGLEHAFGPTLKGRAELGWFWQVVDAGPTFNGPVYNFSITQTGPRTTYTFAFEGGYRESYFTSENLGFSRYHQAMANVTHKLWERMSVGLTGTLGRDEYQNPDRTDWSWSLAGNLSYQPLKWMTVSLEASNNARESDLNGNSFRENRAVLKLTAEY
jgi:hypothetical protein